MLCLHLTEIPPKIIKDRWEKMHLDASDAVRSLRRARLAHDDAHFLRERGRASKRSLRQSVACDGPALLRSRPNGALQCAQPTLQSLVHFLRLSGSHSADANTLHGPASLATCTSKLFAAACHSITTAFTRARLFNSSVKAIGPVPPSAALKLF